VDHLGLGFGVFGFIVPELAGFVSAGFVALLGLTLSGCSKNIWLAFGGR